MERIIFELRCDLGLVGLYLEVIGLKLGLDLGFADPDFRPTGLEFELDLKLIGLALGFELGPVDHDLWLDLQLTGLELGLDLGHVELVLELICLELGFDLGLHKQVLLGVWKT